MGIEIIKILFRFFFLVALQILILNNIQFSGIINPYLYILFIIYLPFELPKQIVLILAFILGFTIDVFSNTGGLHTIATLFLAFTRPVIIKSLGPQFGYPFGSKPTKNSMGIEWFLSYALLLTLPHHIILFFSESFRFFETFYTFLKIISSTIFTMLLIYIYSLFSFWSNKKVD